jgi:hypothetical protein
MITEKLLMPYILASMHPIIHATCLIVQILIKFEYLNGGIKADKIDKDLVECLNIMIGVHIACGFMEFLFKMF